jgi:ribonuclease P protein component
VSSASFPKSARLRRRSEFDALRHATARTGSSHFVFVASPTAAPARLGVIVSKRVGSAVRRNRVKRLCRECFRQWPALRAAHVDILVIAKAGAPSLDLAQTKREFQRLLKLLHQLPAAAVEAPPRDVAP